MSTIIPTTEAQAAVIIPGMRLGKKQARYDPRTPRLARYLVARKQPRIPGEHDLRKQTLKAFPDLGMMLNDKLGDCTCASFGHLFQTWSALGKSPWQPTDGAIRKLYNKVNGGVDEGAAMLDVLKVMRNEGIERADGTFNKIYAFVSFNVTDLDQFRTAFYLFGGLYLGANLPVSAQTQTIWDIGDGSAFTPGSWGGHAFTVIAYGFYKKKFGAWIVTWGRLQFVTWEWIKRYCDEGYVILEEDYVGSDNRSPQGFSLKKLAADLKRF